MKFTRDHARKFFLALGVCVVLAFCSLLAFYAGFEYVAGRLRHEKGYDSGTANAVKHAYAAAVIYELVFPVLGEQRSESAILALGLANEFIERGVKFYNPDSFPEMLKDIHNNFAGLLAARWRADCRCAVGMLDVISGMAERRVLIVSRSRNPYFEDGTDYDTGSLLEADRWLRKNQGAIKARVHADLNRFYSGR